jgi:hypothetical protein
MGDISNKSLAALLVVAIVVSVAGTWMVVNNGGPGLAGISGQASNDVGVTINEFLSLSTPSAVAFTGYFNGTGTANTEGTPGTFVGTISSGMAATVKTNNPAGTTVSIESSEASGFYAGATLKWNHGEGYAAFVNATPVAGAFLTAQGSEVITLNFELSGTWATAVGGDSTTITILATDVV